MRAMRGKGLGTGVGIKGFIETSFLDWPGRVVSVIFLPGCNFRCPFCHNHALVLAPETLEDIPVSHVLESLEKHEGWVDGVVVSGGEPTTWPGLEGLLTLLRRHVKLIKLDTNGSMPGTIKKLIDARLVDAVAMDLKAPLRAREYYRATGTRVDIARVRESIKLLMESPVEVTFRATVVPGLHDAGSVREMAGAAGGRLIIQNFNPADALDPEYRKIKPFTPEELRRLQEIACSDSAG